jgi:hypothetical protein
VRRVIDLRMEGFLRWCQRLSTSSSSSSSSAVVDAIDYNSHHEHSPNDAVQPSSSSSIADHCKQEKEDQKELAIIVDLDISGLKRIKVPERTNHRLAPTDPHKVTLAHNLSLSLSLSLSLCLSLCFCTIAIN